MRLISGAMHSILPPEMRGPVLLGVVLLSVSACKANKGAAEAPEANLDDIAAIEAELSANAARLQAQGLTAPEGGAQQAGGDMTLDDEDGAGASPGTVTPSAPPEPEPDPVTAEEAADEAPAAPMDRERDERSIRKARKRDSRAPTRCERICDLADSTCELADRICGLADAHVDDVRYDEACDRAEAQCELASDACSECEE